MNELLALMLAYPGGAMIVVTAILALLVVARSGTLLFVGGALLFWYLVSS